MVRQGCFAALEATLAHLSMRRTCHEEVRTIGAPSQSNSVTATNAPNGDSVATVFIEKEQLQVKQAV
ncbi:hypothetical protein MLP_15840 [Microlunatus phosphovorus NM-1]|uniref:Uncharacterized protein n=1 Tax=Microlunatus phosphovorus (strain ATCC 700054 / DSM 10555 / JCM 9379 / NBRC 101784 / NCIMB 13414 / VKM Ac-1990 / NM-1) TaxID=1032480 RepID=F5XRA8_MICPN|nr:hypothetical protein MLP_15840 [Microlunatus phosphovorus NM-1]